MSAYGEWLISEGKRRFPVPWARHRREFICRDCGDPPCAPQLHDAVWLSIAGKRDLLCTDCTEELLGRPICLNDLRPCVANAFTIHFALKLVQQVDGVHDAIDYFEETDFTETGRAMDRVRDAVDRR